MIKKKTHVCFEHNFEVSSTNLLPFRVFSPFSLSFNEGFLSLRQKSAFLLEEHMITKFIGRLAIFTIYLVKVCFKAK